jgi:ATP-binding cassette subfamily B protein
LAGLVVIFLPVLFLRLRNSGRLYEVKKSVTAHSRQAAYFSWLLTGEKPAREVRLFDLGKFFEKHFHSSFAASKEPELRVIKANTNYEFLASFVKVMAFAGVLIYATALYIDSGITAGEMAMYLIAFRQAVVYLRDAVSGISGLAENRLFLNDLFHFLDRESDIPINRNISDIHSFSALEAVNLSFTYPGASIAAIRNVNLRIRKGEKVAIVGPNGSGKTTLVKLLCRLYDPGSGDVMLDGVSVSRFDPDEYRRLFSVVFQDFMLYYLSAGDNIRLADSTGSRDKDNVREAAFRAGISGVLENLPEGYETILGHHTGGSRELSWGEWQKIAIARALYRDAPLLVLDEPSSSLDADSEFEIFSELDRITEGRTLILISHRLAYVRNADQIIVLDRGIIAEKGTHDDLMAAKGLYHAMFTKQKSNYL